MEAAGSGALERVPAETIGWLTQPDNPAVAVRTRRGLSAERNSAELESLWAKRNSYRPVAQILEAQLDDGSWATPNRDYKKYEGSLWQIIFLGELWADGSDDRVRAGAEYAFSRQLPDGSWSCSNGRPRGAIPCLTANVARSLARLGYAEDERVVGALGYCVRLYERVGALNCGSAMGPAYQLNGYCHMLVPKTLMLLAEVPERLWPAGSVALRDECLERLREKEVFKSLPDGAREYETLIYSTPAGEKDAVRARFLAEHEPLTYKAKPGWLRFGFPLSYNSDVLEALHALASAGEARRPEYEPALRVVEEAADEQMRWSMRTSFNGKMLADVETKGQPSKWLTLRALEVLDHFS